MRETPEIEKIFEIYYAMGDERSLSKLREKLCQTDAKKIPSLITLKRWSKAFNWQARVEQRDLENSKQLREKLEKETDKVIVNTKADYRVEIKKMNTLLNSLLNRVFEKDEKGKVVGFKIDVNSVNDLTRILQVKDMLMKTDLSLMGEIIGGEEVVVNVQVVSEEGKEVVEKLKLGENT